ncbi:MAG: CBS domain-containing protein [Burkholderiales bacterium]|nr:CBS domain-containing protein [Burkholderiales bacterium]
MNVSEVYSQGTVHIPASCNLQQASQQMLQQHVGALVVTDGEMNGRIAGIVTDRDVVLKAVALGASPNEVSVFDIMTAGVMTIDVNADLADAMQVMSTHGVRRLAVTNEEGVVGILSIDDVIGALGREWSLLSSVIRSEQNCEKLGAVQSPLHL